MNAFALSGLGVTVTPDQISTVASGAASLDPKKSAVTGAIVGTQVLPIIGTAIGAAIGYIAAGIAALFQKKQYTFKQESKGGLTYMTVEQIESGVKASLLIGGIPRSVVCKCPWIGSCDSCRDAFNVFLKSLTAKALNEFVANPNAFTKNYLQNAEYLKYVRESAEKKGFDFNQLPLLIYQEPTGLILTVNTDGQVLSNAPQQKNQNQQILQAGFGWIGALIALSIAGGLWWSAHKAEKNKK